MAAARGLPLADEQLAAAAALLEAGTSLVEAGHIGLGLAGDVVALREADEADPEFALLPGLVELVATSADEADQASRAPRRGADRAGGDPGRGLGQIQEARDLIAGPVATYGPLLDQYRELDDVLPGLLGWGGEKRYLVLAQNPAELRPSGGYTGTVGVVTLRDGEIVEQRFMDTYDLSVQEGLPFVEPARRAGRLPARRRAVLAPRRCQLVARLPDRGPQGHGVLRHRGRRRADRWRHRHHDVCARPPARGRRARRRSRSTA